MARFLDNGIAINAASPEIRFTASPTPSEKKITAWRESKKFGHKSTTQTTATGSSPPAVLCEPFPIVGKTEPKMATRITNLPNPPSLSCRRHFEDEQPNPYGQPPSPAPHTGSPSRRLDPRTNTMPHPVISLRKVSKSRRAFFASEYRR